MHVKIAQYEFFPLAVDLQKCRDNGFTGLCQEEPDGPAVMGIGDPPDISTLFEFSDCPRNGPLVKMIVADKGILGDILFPAEEHQDRELPGRETMDTEPVIKKD